MVLGGGTDTHMFYVGGGCQVAIMGRGCRIGLKKCIGVLADSSIVVVGC